MPTLLQYPLRLLFPDQCVSCGAPVEDRFSLCGTCWRDTTFLGESVCDACGIPLMGPVEPDERPHCDTCMAHPRPWDRGRAALHYRDTGRRLILGFKHGDRMDLAPAFARWMARAGRPLFDQDLCLVRGGSTNRRCWPDHWRRFGAWIGARTHLSVRAPPSRKSA